MLPRWLVVLALVTLPLQGCLGGVLGESCTAADVALLAGPRQHEVIPRAPGEDPAVLYWLQEGDGSPAFGQLAVQGDTLALDTVLQAADAECEAEGETTLLRFGDEVDADTTEPGQGVLVVTAGFWPNGTLFYTNMPRVQFNESYPKPVAGEMGQWGNSQPLPVYIYEESRDEMPPRYEEAGYFTTIPGFNAMLKGMTVGTARVAELAPEQAYTREGNEDHPLFGDTLIFFTQLLAIEEVPCQVPEPVCELPQEPVRGSAAAGAAVLAPR